MSTQQLHMIFIFKIIHKKLPSVFLLSVLLVIQFILLCDTTGKESSSNCDDISAEACASLAYEQFQAGNKELALNLANIACEKGSSTGCYNSACYLAEEGQIERALQSLKKYFSFPVSCPIFSDAVSDPQLKVLFANDKSLKHSTGATLISLVLRSPAYD